MTVSMKLIYSQVISTISIFLISTHLQSIFYFYYKKGIAITVISVKKTTKTTYWIPNANRIQTQTHPPR